MKVKDLKKLLDVCNQELKTTVRSLNDVDLAVYYDHWDEFLEDGVVDNYELIDKFAVDVFDTEIIIWCK